MPISATYAKIASKAPIFSFYVLTKGYKYTKKENLEAAQF